MKNPNKQKQIDFIFNSIQNLDKSYWGNCSDSWGTSQYIAMIHVYNCNDLISWGFKSPESEFMNELSDKYDLMNFIYKNIKSFNFYERIHIASNYDCTGQCCGTSLTVKKFGDSVIILKSASYDI